MNEASYDNYTNSLFVKSYTMKKWYVIVFRAPQKVFDTYV